MGSASLRSGRRRRRLTTATGLLACCAAVLSAGVPAQAAPVPLDAPFGDLGLVRGPAGGLGPVVAQPNGDVVAAGTDPAFVLTSGSVVVVRRHDDGTLDPAFGDGGQARIPATGANLTVTGMARTADGGVVVVASSTAGAFVARLTAAGQPDVTFGPDGRRAFGTARSPASASGIVVGADGTTLVGIGLADHGLGVVRLLADGTPDGSFSADGIAETGFDPVLLPDRYDVPGQGALATLADGTILVGGARQGPADARPQPQIAAFTPDGEPDPSFGAGGMLALPGDGQTVGLVAAPAGGVLALVAGSGSGAVVRLRPDLAVDPAFGVDGRAPVDVDPSGTTSVVGLVPLPGGGALVAGTAHATAVEPTAATAEAAGAGRDGIVLARLTAAGVVDPSYADGGRARVDAAGPDAVALGLTVDGAGRAIIAGSGAVSGTFASQLLVRTHSYIVQAVPAAAAPLPPHAPGIVRIAALRVTHGSLTVRAGRVRIPLRCRTARCNGTLTITRRGTTIARARVALAPGTAVTPRVRLTAAGRRLARRHARLQARITVRLGTASATRTAVTLRFRR